MTQIEKTTGVSCLNHQIYSFDKQHDGDIYKRYSHHILCLFFVENIKPFSKNLVGGYFHE